MSFHEILIAVMAVFAVLGAIDRIFGNRWGLGKEFEEGILAMGSLALAMVGIVSLAPVLAAVLKPVVVPIFGFLGADPAMFAGTILACDMGGGALAMELTENADAATTYAELYALLQTYSSLSDSEKSNVAVEFSAVQQMINEYNAQAETANNELSEATELAFAPLATVGFSFVAALWFLLKKKFWM